MMRHGEAETGADNDMQRQLTPGGREDIQQIVSSHTNDLSQIDTIWVSSYVRAQQTAEIVAAALSKPVVTQSFLSPSSNPQDVLDALQADRHQTLLIVTHQPLVGILVDGLAGLETGRYRMGTGSLACISTDVYAFDCGELRYLNQPASVCS